jgi:CDP-glycerol glycerophosphotransferase
VRRIEDGRRRRSVQKTSLLGWAVSPIVRVIPKKSGSVVIYGLTESEDGALALQKALLGRGIRPIRLTGESAGSKHRSRNVVYRSKRSLRGWWCFARASVVFTSHALYGGRSGGPRQRTVLLWHGEVVKPVGLFDGDEPVPADVAPVCSALGRAFRAAEFGLHPSRVPVVGAPRNDRLLTAVRAEVRQRLAWASEETVWIWLPTYRQSVRGEIRQDVQVGANGLPFDEAALLALDRLLGGHGITLVVKAHPAAEQRIGGGYANIRVLGQSELDERGVSLYEALAAVDGLVTDVSSVWIDYLLTGKPLIFAFPDLDEYRTSRGLNLEPYEDWVPGPVVGDVEALAAEMARLSLGDDSDDYRDQREAARRRFHRYTDAGSTERVLGLLGL